MESVRKDRLSTLTCQETEILQVRRPYPQYEIKGFIIEGGREDTLPRISKLCKRSSIIAKPVLSQSQISKISTRMACCATLIYPHLIAWNLWYLRHQWPDVATEEKVLFKKKVSKKDISLIYIFIFISRWNEEMESLNAIWGVEFFISNHDT